MGLTHENLRNTLNYDKETGLFRWIVKRKGIEKSGIAGRITDQGYRVICIDYKQYRAHRLAWLYIYGEWPPHEIDHINGIRSDNRIENLRSATHKQNRRNSLMYASNKTGFKGVYFYKQKKKWVAQIKMDGTTKYLGIFSKPEDAYEAYCNAGKLLDPIFFNDGSKTRTAIKKESASRSPTA